ncbi:MAG TPA: S4 domain-containing protein [Bacillota bacterium]|nr:S4 domain-containing protein [Bacillota bacterium]
MRLDKFLKLSRLVRRRTVAHDLADQGRVLINGKPGKPATPVRAGDVIRLDLGGRTMQVEVKSVHPAADPDSLYRITEMESGSVQSGRR